MRARQKELAEIISIIRGNKEAPPPPDNPILCLPLRLLQLPARIVLQCFVVAKLAACSLLYCDYRSHCAAHSVFMEECAPFFYGAAIKSNIFNVVTTFASVT